MSESPRASRNPALRVAGQPAGRASTSAPAESQNLCASVGGDDLRGLTGHGREQAAQAVRRPGHIPDVF